MHSNGLVSILNSGPPDRAPKGPGTPCQEFVDKVRPAHAETTLDCVVTEIY